MRGRQELDGLGDIRDRTPGQLGAALEEERIEPARVLLAQRRRTPAADGAKREPESEQRRIAVTLDAAVRR